MRIDDEKNEKTVQEYYDDYWKPIQQNLDTKMDDFIRHYFTKDGAVVNKNNVYATFKKRNDVKKQTDVVISLKELAKFAKYYEKLIEPVKEKNQELRDRLLRLNQIEVTIIYPLLLSLYADYNSKPQRISEEQFIEVLELLENFLVRRFICKVAPLGLNRIFPHFYGKIFKNNFLDIEGLKVELSKQKYPTDSQFINAFKTAHLYGLTGKRKKLKMMLGRLENFQNKEPVNVNDSKISIEHIMPKKLTPEWEKMLGDDYESIHKTLCHTIGNLTLSGVNSKLE